MNFADSERLCNLMVKHGWTETKNITDAKLLIAIGCSVRQKAENRVLSFLESNKFLKKKGTIFCLAGCTANLHKEKIIEKLPFLDIVCGPNHLKSFPEILENLESVRPIVKTGENDYPFLDNIPSNKITLSLPITKGCNNFCSYCVVPLARGRLQSKSPDTVIKEIKDAVENGTKAVILLGQNVNEYGKDFDKQYDFADLIKDILKIDGILRIGFLTSHPEDTSISLLQIMAENSRIIKHLHIPIQSGSNRILCAMNRKYTVEKFFWLVETARKMMPEISITSDVMVGFPGETQEDFNETLQIVKKIRFNELFVFKYSPRPMTYSAKLPETISKAEKEHRHSLILETQKQISKQILNEFKGKICEVLVERKSVKNQGKLIGKNIQGISVSFEGHHNLIGKIIKVKIIGQEEGILCGKADEGCLLRQG